jgi:predicted ribosomally synthesized peptide with nif11-like leader
MEVNTSRPLQAMSEEQLKAFLEAVKVDVGLQEQLKEAKDMDSVVAIAKAAGFVISVEELNKAQAELSEEELEGIAGGITPILGFASCFCYAGVAFVLLTKEELKPNSSRYDPTANKPWNT